MMKKLLVLLIWGVVISFLGSLPLGTMNIAITQIVLQKGTSAGYQFAAGAILVEIVYVRVALPAMAWIFKQTLFFRLFEWVTICLLLILSIGSFHAALYMRSFGETIPIHFASAFLLGIFLSLINPLHIPFWFGWSSLLANKKILQPNALNYNMYVAGISIGSLMGLMVFIVGSRYMITHLKSNERMIQVVVGLVLLITAIVQLYKIRKKRELKLSALMN